MDSKSIAIPPKIPANHTETTDATVCIRNAFADDASTLDIQLERLALAWPRLMPDERTRLLWEIESFVLPPGAPPAADRAPITEQTS